MIRERRLNHKQKLLLGLGATALALAAVALLGWRYRGPLREKAISIRSSIRVQRESKRFLPAAGGWEKLPEPVLGGEYGVMFDPFVLREEGVYRMLVSWRQEQGLALSESEDGQRWSAPELILTSNLASGWETEVNRGCAVLRDGIYHVWYTGQVWEDQSSAIGYARGTDLRSLERVQPDPVMTAREPWEQNNVMCPHVLWDEGEQLYKMWYSAGEMREPNAIGYAVSPDGVHWTRRPEPVFTAARGSNWENHKVTACQVIPWEDGYLMFYIGFSNEDTARIGLARSSNGITNWEKCPANPILSLTPGGWDGEACYKPFAIYEPERDRWLLWYNGRTGNVEQIGLAVHEGKELF
ncbi:MAG: hypothetical protein LBJ11_05370 [Oscillospiraceae bacterium]|jgi:predicted GH43/DUF377 family glycosyl hydrolase|nr:hypothetical protein [Oscillospiraceae bacterium]